MINNSLTERTKKALALSTLTYLQIAERSGLNIHWLHKFARGGIKSPAADKIQKLYEFLTGRPLV